MTIKKQRLIQALLTFFILAAGIAIFSILKKSRPNIEFEKPEIPLPIVHTIEVDTLSQEISLSGYGTVNPIHEISLAPQVGGKIIEISHSLVNGGAFKKDHVLLQIDPQDYEIAVTLAEANIKDAENNFALAKQEAEAARDEWRQLHGKTPPPPLVAKQPQLAAAQSKLDAAEAELRKAQLQLERTTLKAPFDGRVSEKLADLGQYVSVGQKLATLFATNAVEIVVPMAFEDLAWFHVPGFTNGNGPGATADVQAQVAGQVKKWRGRVVRAQGVLDEQTRMVNIVLRVDEPYVTRPPLAVGLFAEVTIKGNTLPEAVLIPRPAVRDGNRVWVIEGEDRLIFRNVEVARMNTGGALIGNGLSKGEHVVTSSLKGVSDGMRVKIAGQQEKTIAKSTIKD
ncbi:MAG: efflux RND transporter periplasmic adaptor subunit [Desulfobacteraceae bacterium]|nr:efflux RND transporter periplasmic adaptor subunit [Desulfobacteraceae bacterium]